MSFAQVDTLMGYEVWGGIFYVSLFVVVAVFLWMLYILHTCYRRIPPVYREVQPWHVWLVLIPCAGWFFGLFIFPNLARSYQNYFQEHRRTDVGNCGRQLSWWVAWTFPPGTLAVAQLCALPVPDFFCFFTPLFLVLLVIFVIQATELRNLIPADAAQREQAEDPTQKKSASKITAMWRENRTDSWHSTTPGKKAPAEMPASASDAIELDLNSLTSALGQPEVDRKPAQPPEETKRSDNEEVDEPTA
jgi:hypothetical protein